MSERLNQVEADSPSVEQKKVADTSELFADPNRHVVEVPDSFAGSLATRRRRCHHRPLHPRNAEI